MKLYFYSLEVKKGEETEWFIREIESEAIEKNGMWYPKEGTRFPIGFYVQKHDICKTIGLYNHHVVLYVPDLDLAKKCFAENINKKINFYQLILDEWQRKLKATE